MSRIDPRLVALLRESGVAWELEDRRRHRLLRVEGRVVLALPRAHRDGCRHAKNAVAALRRHLATLEVSVQTTLVRREIPRHQP